MVDFAASAFDALRAIASRDTDPRHRAAAERALRSLPVPTGGAPSPTDAADQRAAATLAERVVDNLDRDTFVRDLAPLRALTMADFGIILGRLVASLLTFDRGGATLTVAVERMADVVRAWHTGREGVALARLPDMSGRWDVGRRLALGAALTFVEPEDIVLALIVPKPPGDELLASLEALARAADRLGRVELPSGERFAPELGRLAQLLDRREPFVRSGSLAHSAGHARDVIPVPSFEQPPASEDGASWHDADEDVDGLLEVDLWESVAYPLLAAPERVRVRRPFEFRVGLAPEALAGVVAPAPLTLPGGDVDVTVNLNVSGFEILGSVRHELTLRVRPLDLYPSEVLRLAAVDDSELTSRRTLQASYHVGGRLVGMAFRQVEVVGGVGPAGSEAPKGRSRRAVGGWSLDPHAEDAPDLYLIAGTTNTQGHNALAWNIVSPHPEVGRPAEPVVRRIGRDDAEWLRGQYREIDSGDKDLALFLRNLGRRVAGAMPDQVWEAIYAVAAATSPRPPAVLLATDEPHIPWELARLPSDWQVEDCDVLGGYVAFSRWIVDPDESQENLPSATVKAATMAAVSGTYQHADLPHATEEAARLVADFGAVPVEATKARVLEMLQGEPAKDIVHFAVHGTFDQFDTADGIVLVDGGHLSASEIGGLEPFGGKVVFLNACQLGQSHQVLGRYAGMMAAFLRLGAMATIAPLWKVADEEAYAIGTAFYRSVLVDGVSPAEFLRQQRQATTGREAEPFGTRLAYLYFGHPRLSVAWAGTAAVEEPST